MYEDLVEHYSDIEVKRSFNLNGADFCFNALVNDNIDTFVEYTGAALTNFCHLPVNSDADKVYKQVHDTMLSEYNVVTSAPWGSIIYM